MSAPHGATWRSGDATVCKTVYTGSIPVVASNKFNSLREFLLTASIRRQRFGAFQVVGDRTADMKRAGAACQAMVVVLRPDPWPPTTV